MEKRREEGRGGEGEREGEEELTNWFSQQ